MIHFSFLKYVSATFFLVGLYFFLFIKKKMDLTVRISKMKKSVPAGNFMKQPKSIASFEPRFQAPQAYVISKLNHGDTRRIFLLKYLRKLRLFSSLALFFDLCASSWKFSNNLINVSNTKFFSNLFGNNRLLFSSWKNNHEIL